MAWVLVGGRAGGRASACARRNSNEGYRYTWWIEAVAPNTLLRGRAGSLIVLASVAAMLALKSTWVQSDPIPYAA